MRHLKAGKHLGRNAEHRLALYRNLALALFRHERIITTLEKAKAVRPFVEKLITLAKKGTLHARRLVISRLGPTSSAWVRPINDADTKNKVEEDTRTIVQKLFADLGPRFKDRPGGYTRIVKRHQRRLGDGGHTAILELLKEGEVKVQTRAPAPRIEEETPTEEPQTEQAQAEQSQTTEPASDQLSGLKPFPGEATLEQASSPAPETPPEEASASPPPKEDKPTT